MKITLHFLKSHVLPLTQTLKSNGDRVVKTWISGDEKHSNMNTLGTAEVNTAQQGG